MTKIIYFITTNYIDKKRNSKSNESTKKRLTNLCKPFFVGVAGLEPATTCTPCKHASQLHHTPFSIRRSKGDSSTIKP